MSTKIAGVDGCPSGWLAVSMPVDRPAEAEWIIYPTFAKLLAATSDHAAIAIDIPIGLPDIAELGGRAADRAARAVLGGRQSSVFAIPSRPAIACTDYREACAVALAHSDPPRKISKQAFNLFPKIREVDDLMTPKQQERVVECHPEVAFWALNGKVPLEEPKKLKSKPYEPGLELRRRLLKNAGFDAGFLSAQTLPRRLASPDDLLDACATAWTAQRYHFGTAEHMPPGPGTPRDSKKLRIEIVY